MHDIFGSSAYLRGAEVVVGLQLVRPGHTRLSFFKDRDGDLPIAETWGLLFDREQGYRRDPDHGKPKETANDKVKSLLLAEQGGQTIDQLRQRTGYADKTIRNALKAISATPVPSTGREKVWTARGGATP